jgi:hypothetical protein
MFLTRGVAALAAAGVVGASCPKPIIIDTDFLNFVSKSMLFAMLALLTLVSRMMTRLPWE